MIICYHNFNFQLEIYLLSDIVRSLGLDGPSEDAGDNLTIIDGVSNLE